MKNSDEMSIKYLLKFPKGFIEKYYEKKQMEYKVFIKLMQSLRGAIGKNSEEKVVDLASDIFESFVRTANFAFSLKMLLKKEKEEVTSLVQRLKELGKLRQETIQSMLMYIKI